MWESRKRIAKSFLSLTIRDNPNSLLLGSPPSCTIHFPIQFLPQIAQSSALHNGYYCPTTPSTSKHSSAIPMFLNFSSAATSQLQTSQVNSDVIHSGVDQDTDSINHDNDSLVDDDDEEEDYRLGFPKELVGRRKDIEKEVGLILDIIKMPRESCALVKNKLEQCGVTVSSELVVEVLSRVRNDWEAAFTFFLWAGKQPGYTHSVRAYHSMIAVLGKMRKFDTAWALIMEMKSGGTDGKSIVTPQTLLIMIRRYCAVHDVGKAIHTFYAHKRFGFEIGMQDFHNLLSALCRYKNVKDAEHLLFCNKDVFLLNTKSFNIILNGWCNIIGSTREGKRVWWEMSERGISRDVVSYSCLISCNSKASKVKVVLNLFERMKAENIAPDRKVYNAVIHTLAKANRVKDARDLMKLMEEKGTTPDAVTYNSMIMPLCRAHQLDEAKEAFDEMLKRGLSPTVRTYHAFLDTLRTAEEVFELLKKMSGSGCQPSHDTYTMLIRKFCRWRQLDNVFKLWNDMSRNGLDPDASSYNALIHGLFLNGKLEEAYKYSLEMKSKHLLLEPKLYVILQTWVSDKQGAGGG